MSAGITMGGSGPSPAARSSSRNETVTVAGVGGGAVAVAAMGRSFAISSFSEGWKMYMATMAAPKYSRPKITNAMLERLEVFINSAPVCVARKEAVQEYP